MSASICIGYNNRCSCLRDVLQSLGFGVFFPSRSVTEAQGNSVQAGKLAGLLIRDPGSKIAATPSPYMYHPHNFSEIFFGVQHDQIPS
jgi:hypothetical protein